MGFKDLQTESGITSLNEFLQDKSYINGYVPSQADVVVVKAVKESLVTEKFPHAARWYRQIKSYSSSESAKFPGAALDISAYGPSGATSEPSKAPAEEKDDEDDDGGLWGSDEEEETEEEKRIREERLAAYAAKKANKKAVIAKSEVTLNCKPWGEETDMAEMEKLVKSVTMDGLIWAGSKLVPVAYGIKMLEIKCVIEDDKVSTEDLSDKIIAFEDHVQSCDIAGFAKI